MVSNPTSRYIPKGIESRDSNRSLEANAHRRIIHNNQKVEMDMCVCIP